MVLQVYHNLVGNDLHINLASVPFYCLIHITLFVSNNAFSRYLTVYKKTFSEKPLVKDALDFIQKNTITERKTPHESKLH